MSLNINQSFQTPHILGFTTKDHEFVTPDVWAVSVVRKRGGKNPNHIFLIIQGINKIGRDLLYRAHLTVEDDSFIGCFKPQPAIIKLDDYSDTFVRAPDKIEGFFSDCIHRTAWITTELGEKILKRVEDDQKEEISYSLVENDLKQISVNIGISKQTMNCASWAESVLEREEIELFNKSDISIILKLPSVLIPDEKSNSGNCIMS
jgi:hypothetical protein